MSPALNAPIQRHDISNVMIWHQLRYGLNARNEQRTKFVLVRKRIKTAIVAEFFHKTAIQLQSACND